MGPFLLVVSVALLGITVRNLVGRPAKAGLISGWIATVGFAFLAAFCFWRTRDLQLLHGPVEMIAAGRRFMVVFMAGLLLASWSVGVQRRKLRAAMPRPADPPARSGSTTE
jgi:hypothetical protein